MHSEGVVNTTYRRNKYIGTKSCYAVHEGVYVPGKGLTEETFLSVMALILRDVKRGWSYDDHCNRIPFSKSYALQRTVWAGALSFTHTDKEVARSLMDLGREVLEQERLPEWVRIAIAGKNAGKVAQELVTLGIARPGQVEVVVGGEAVSLRA
jgi:hypothetical protein